MFKIHIFKYVLNDVGIKWGMMHFAIEYKKYPINILGIFKYKKTNIYKKKLIFNLTIF